ncbi:carboxypeptidase-like regulatory domain-containing protein [Nocardia iowensis]|uniref:Carboxypeptidase-like regulatory domain-containing protein n=1 Tax=Nocardia iowensis TaxID=204891 RepID=A0ABX8S2X1_NOCIO|nr:carboxypeptidase-like regulatory domain-containing protein [Nocardia iowensis]
MVRTITLSGAPVPNVPVTLRLLQLCNPATHDIPPNTTEGLRRDTVTDQNGSATLSLPLGCYSLDTNTPPPGMTPFPKGMQSLFLQYPGLTVDGELRFQESGPQPPCSAQTVVLELDDLDAHLLSANATVSECDGQWAFVAWDSPGDSARLIRRAATGWTTYVRFPHDVCWTKAAADGVPARMKEHFTC